MHNSMCCFLLTHGSRGRQALPVLITAGLAPYLICLGFCVLSDGSWKREGAARGSLPFGIGAESQRLHRAQGSLVPAGVNGASGNHLGGCLLLLPSC